MSTLFFTILKMFKNVFKIYILVTHWYCNKYKYFCRTSDPYSVKADRSGLWQDARTEVVSMTPSLRSRPRSKQK